MSNTSQGNMPMFDPPAFDAGTSETVRRTRREDRYATASTVTMSTPGTGMFKAALVDLSAKGARLRVPVELASGTPIILEIERARLLSATVIWTRARDVGIAFDEPLSPDMLRSLVVRSWLSRG